MNIRQIFSAYVVGTLLLASSVTPVEAASFKEFGKGFCRVSYSIASAIVVGAYSGFKTFITTDKISGTQKLIGLAALIGLGYFGYRLRTEEEEIMKAKEKKAVRRKGAAVRKEEAAVRKEEEERVRQEEEERVRQEEEERVRQEEEERVRQEEEERVRQEEEERVRQEEEERVRQEEEERVRQEEVEKEKSARSKAADNKVYRDFRLSCIELNKGMGLSELSLFKILGISKVLKDPASIFSESLLLDSLREARRPLSTSADGFDMRSMLVEYLEEAKDLGIMLEHFLKNDSNWRKWRLSLDNYTLLFNNRIYKEEDFGEYAGLACAIKKRLAEEMFKYEGIKKQLPTGCWLSDLVDDGPVIVVGKNTLSIFFVVVLPAASGDTNSRILYRVDVPR